MTKILIDKETVMLALEALNTPRPEDSYPPLWRAYKATIDSAITALRQALEQSTEQEPDFKKAYLVWQEKTEWVQETAQLHELGMHRADVLRQRIEQSTEQEPVAWLHWLYGPVQVFLNKDEAMMELDRLNREYPVDDDSRQMKSLYTQPQEAAPCLTLTDEDLQKIWLEQNKTDGSVIWRFARAIIAAYEAKNEITGEKE